MNFDSLCVKDEVKFLRGPGKDTSAKLWERQGVFPGIAPVPNGRGQRYRKTVKDRMNQELVVLVWDGVELIFLTVASVWLCFGFTPKVGLITQGYFRYG